VDAVGFADSKPVPAAFVTRARPRHRRDFARTYGRGPVGFKWRAVLAAVLAIGIVRDAMARHWISLAVGIVPLSIVTVGGVARWQLERRGRATRV
jgi:hypothetical protein